MKLTKSLQAWQTPAFEKTLRTEIEALDGNLLPLQQGLTQGSHALEDTVTATIIRITDTDDSIQVKAGIFYRSIIAGCSCADDPTPVDELSEYCEVLLEIDKATAETTITLAT